MTPYFNVAGPCIPGEHYMLPAQERCRGVLNLIERKQYFVIHAARQSGKTTLLKELARQINAEGNITPFTARWRASKGLQRLNRAFRQSCEF